MSTTYHLVWQLLLARSNPLSFAWWLTLDSLQFLLLFPSRLLLWWVDRFSFYRGWLAYNLLRVISSDHMYFPTWWFSLVDFSDVFDNWSGFLAADDDDDDDVVDFVSIGYSRFARQSFTSASCLDFIFCFLSSRCLSPWSVRLSFCSLSIFSLLIIIMLTHSFRRWRSCNPDVFMLRALVSLVYPGWKSNPLVRALKSSLKMV